MKGDDSGVREYSLSGKGVYGASKGLQMLDR